MEAIFYMIQDLEAIMKQLPYGHTEQLKHGQTTELPNDQFGPVNDQIGSDNCKVKPANYLDKLMASLNQILTSWTS